MTLPRGKLQRPPTSPGAFIAEDILEAFDLTQEELAARLDVSRRTVNQLINGGRGVSADMALRLARVTGTTPRFWLNLQAAVDLWNAERAGSRDIARLRPLAETA